MQQCGLVEVQRKMIGHLSKGFQQRVGLADALVHEPELIILDEPTIGLDPNQIRAVRALIKDLGQRHTVLISSHILPEVEMTCSRVLVVRQGKIVAAGSPDDLRAKMSKSGQVVAEIAAPLAALNECWEAMPEVEHYDVSPVEGEFFRCALTPREGCDLRLQVYFLVRERGWVLRELSRSQHSLEDVFVAVTRNNQEEETF